MKYCILILEWYFEKLGMWEYVYYVLDYGSKLTLVQLFRFVIFRGTNLSADILSLEDVLLQLFLSTDEDFRDWMDLYNVL